MELFKRKKETNKEKEINIVRYIIYFFYKIVCCYLKK